MSMQKMNDPIVNHIYYEGFMFKSSSIFYAPDSRFQWATSGGADWGGLYSIYKNVGTDNWIKLSAIDSLSDVSNSGQWYIRNFQVNPNEYSYVDSIIIIDLTETFGSNNEPTKEWCDQHISYFDGTTVVYK